MAANILKSHTNPVFHPLMKLVALYVPLCALLLSFAGNIQAQEKQIYVTTNSQDATLDFSFSPTAQSFKPGEPITFNVSTNRDIFLYVYTKNADGSYTMILPNSAQKQNKYPANSTLPVPNASAQFRADGSVPVETVFAIASTRYIDLEIAGQKQAGDFTILSSTHLEDKFASKGIIIRPTVSEVQVAREVEVISEVRVAQPTVSRIITEVTPPVNARIVQESAVRRVDLRINQPLPPVSDELVTFIATDRQDYRLNDIVQVVYGATQPGSVTLYMVDPSGGTMVPVATRNVDGQQYSRLSFRHTGPLGAHILKAIYSREGAGNNKAITVSATTPNQPGLTAEASLQFNQ